MTDVRSGGREYSYGDLSSNPFDLDADRLGRIAVQTDDAATVLSAFASLDGIAAQVALIPSDRPIAEFELPRILKRPAGGPTIWTLFTSGTTGEPKPISHTLASLSRTVVPEAGADLVWGLLYDPTRMAGVQVVLQAWRSRARLVAAAPSATLSVRLRELADGGVTALSATPTIWRRILQSPVALDLNLRQITLGGEIADQMVLDGLRARFPSARIVHVYAATETGAAFSVSDGRSGFPVGYLNGEHRGVRLDIRGGELFVYAPGVDVAAADGFVATGDLVEVADDRVYFLGRSSGVVNVGGVNVWPEQVEMALRAHPGIAEVSVTARPNPMTGNLLVAAVVLEAGADVDGRDIRRWARERLPTYQVPATITVVESVDLSATGKVKR